jgi:hypothetical protein
MNQELKKLKIMTMKAIKKKRNSHYKSSVSILNLRIHILLYQKDGGSSQL